jgi:hypothetical protein
LHSFTYGELGQLWVRQGFEARQVAGYRYSWILRDPSGRWQIGYPSPQGGENRKRLFPRAWANRQIRAFRDREELADPVALGQAELAEIGWQHVPAPLGSTAGKGT